MELHSLPVDCYIGGIFEGMLGWFEKDGCPQPEAKQAIDEDGGTEGDIRPLTIPTCGLENMCTRWRLETSADESRSHQWLSTDPFFTGL